MAGLRQLIHAFNGGELSPRMSGRSDLDGIWDRGLAEMYNFVCTVEGPAMKRPGVRFIIAAAASSTWLSRFVFNVTEAYLLEWLEGKLRFYTNGGRIDDPPGTPYEVPVPYTAAEAPRVCAVQSKNRLRLAHYAHPPAALSRTDATHFAYAPLALAGGPFQDQNSDETVTVSLAGTFTVGGVVTITASSAIFRAGHVGAPFLVECKDYSDIPAWEVGLDGIVSGSSKRRSDFKVYLAASSGRTGTIAPVHTHGTEYDGAASGADVNTKGPFGVKWTYLYDRFGIGTITAVALDGLSATMTVTRRFPDSLSSAPSFKWAYAAFSDDAGYPEHVVIFSGRQWFFHGFEIYGSVSADYDNFARFTDGGLFTADMGFHRTLDAADPPLFVKVDKEGLIAVTASGEILVAATNRTLPIGGDNLSALPQSAYGAAEIWPIDTGTGFIFVVRGGRKLMEAQFSYDQGRFVGVNMTAWARHITRSGMVQLAFQQAPEEMLWGVREDGLMIAHAHAPEQQVKGFARQAIADGAIAVLSAVSIPSDDGTRDDLWVLAELDGVKGVGRLDPWWEEDPEANDAERLAQLRASFYVDWGVSYQGTPKRHFTTGLLHLAGRDVAVLADGGVVTARSVTNAGVLTPDLPYDAGEVHIGLGYTGVLQPMPAEARGAPSMQGLRKRIVKLVARLLDSAGLVIRDNKGHLDRLLDRPVRSTMDQPVPLFTGDTDMKSVGGGYDRAGQPAVISTDPLPCIVPMLTLELECERLT